MDGKGRALDNVRTERFFRSLKYEDVYIKAYEDARSLRLGVGAYIADYNAVRPHQALGGLTPEQVYNSRRARTLLESCPEMELSDIEKKGAIRFFFHFVS